MWLKIAEKLTQIYRKFSICFVLRFLAKLSNNLSYILYRKFSIGVFCAAFFG